MIDTIEYHYKKIIKIIHIVIITLKLNAYNFSDGAARAFVCQANAKSIMISQIGGISIQRFRSNSEIP